MDAQVLSHEMHVEERSLLRLAPGLPLRHGGDGQESG